MVQLGDHVGANLRTKQRIEIIRAPNGAGTGGTTPHVKIDSLDVSISRILTELRQANMLAHSIEVFLGDAPVCTLFPTSTKG
jgi:hypothetical protein